MRSIYARNILQADAPTARRVIFVFHIMGCSSQLFMFTYSCDCLMQDSTNVATAMYAAPWTRLPMNQGGKMMRRDLLLVVMRSRLPCCITACGFFAISLETYTRVIVKYSFLFVTHLSSCLRNLIHHSVCVNVLAVLYISAKVQIY